MYLAHWLYMCLKSFNNTSTMLAVSDADYTLHALRKRELRKLLTVHNDVQHYDHNYMPIEILFLTMIEIRPKRPSMAFFKKPILTKTGLHVHASVTI